MSVCILKYCLLPPTQSPSKMRGNSLYANPELTAVLGFFEKGDIKYHQQIKVDIMIFSYKKSK